MLNDACFADFMQMLCLIYEPLVSWSADVTSHLETSLLLKSFVLPGVWPIAAKLCSWD